MSTELIDQEGYILSIGVGRMAAWRGLVIKGADVDILINGGRLLGAQSLELRAVGAEAEGHIAFRSRVDRPEDDVERLMGMGSFSMLVLVCHPEHGREVRRISLSDCHWSAPTLVKERPNRATIDVDLTADQVRDDVLIDA